MVHRHRNGLFGHVGHCGKPALTQLLLTAVLIEVHNDVRVGRFYIARWVVERKMPVFADSNKRNVNRVLFDQFVEALALYLWVTAAIDVVERGEWSFEFLREPLLQVLLERGRVLLCHANIFIEMETRHLAPVDTGDLFEHFEHLELRCARGKDDVCLSILSKHLSDNSCSLQGGHFAVQLLGLADDYLSLAAWHTNFAFDHADLRRDLRDLVLRVGLSLRSLAENEGAGRQTSN